MLIDIIGTKEIKLLHLHSLHLFTFSPFQVFVFDTFCLALCLSHHSAFTSGVLWEHDIGIKIQTLLLHHSEKAMTPHSSTLAWKGPWTEEPGRLQSMGSRRVGQTERLHFHFSPSCIGEGNGNPLQCSCLENPRDGEAWWAAVYGVAQSQTRLKRLSSSSCIIQLTRLLRKSLWDHYSQYFYMFKTLRITWVHIFGLYQVSLRNLWKLSSVFGH